MIFRISLAGILLGLLTWAQQAGVPNTVPNTAPNAAPEGIAATFRTEARLVEVYASVFDKHNNPLPNLTRDKFQILDNGKPQEITSFEGSADKVSCALLLDVTGSMEAFLPLLQTAIVGFVDELNEGQEVSLYTFTTSLRLAQPFTSDKKRLKQAVLRTRAGGGTALFDAVSNVTHDLEARKGKKAIVLFTDGADNASALNASGASRRARLSGVPIYAIAEGDALRDHALLKTLDELAADSGGLVFRLDHGSKIREVFSAIVRDMNSTYLLSWKLPENAGQGWHSVSVSVKEEKGAIVRGRQGYYPQ